MYLSDSKVTCKKVNSFIYRLIHSQYFVSTHTNPKPNLHFIQTQSQNIPPVCTHTNPMTALGLYSEMSKACLY